METPRPRISVIVPTWNNIETLQETIDCLQAQTWRSWTAQVIDGGSSDGTLEDLQDLARQDERFQVRPQQSKGLSGARNEALQQASGDLIHCLDADDLIDADFYARAAAAWEQTDETRRDRLCLVSDACKFVAPRRVILEAPVPEPEYFTWEAMTRECRVPCNAMIFSRALLAQTGVFDESIYTLEDWDLWVRFLRCGAAFTPLPGTKSWYRIHQGTVSRNYVKYLPAAWEVIQRFCREDDRCTEVVENRLLDQDQAMKTMIRFWRENLRRAASECDASALKSLYAWAGQTLPATFWTEPTTWIEQLDFRAVDVTGAEASLHALEIESRLHYAAAMLRGWQGEVPSDLAANQVASLLYFIGAEGRRFLPEWTGRLEAEAKAIAKAKQVPAKLRWAWKIAFHQPDLYSRIRKSP